MADTNATGGLKWVKEEIVANLQRVRSRFEDYVENGSDPEQSRLDEAVKALGEVRGVLSALQLRAPALLAEEMERLCEGLVTQSVSNTIDASEALMLALIQLPDYLDRIGVGQADAPLVLLPSINDLRISRSAAPISGAELLAPTSAVADSQLPPADVQTSWKQVADMLRPHFHLHLLQWLRSDSPRQGLVELGKHCQQLQGVSDEGVFHDLFLVASTLIKELLDGNIADDTKVKVLIAHLDRIIKPLATDPEAWPEEQARSQLFELLTLLSQCAPSSSRVNELLIFYGLSQEAAGEGDGSAPTTTGPGLEAFGMLVAEAKKELAPIKDALDLFARGNRKDHEQLLRLGPQLRNLANTLSVAGADDLAGRLHRCGDDLAALGQGRVTTDDLQLARVAEEMLFVEMALGDLGMGSAPEAGREEIRALISSTLKEVRADLAKAERAINELVATSDNQFASKDVSELLGRVAGALRILSEDDAAQVLDLVLEQVERRFLHLRRPPSEGERDLLAQAVSGIDLYITGLNEGEHYSANLVAEARRAVDELRDTSIPASATAVEEPRRTDEGAGTEAIGSHELEISFACIDPDFLDIFLEEAREEEQTIRDRYARWHDDESDEVSLATLARSFHTLKGSGRLVGAMRVGDLARAFEILLNRLIDGTLKTTPEVVRLVGEAVDVLPDLIVAEAEQGRMDISELIARADSFAPPPVEAAAPAAEPKSAEVISWPAGAVSPVSEAAPEEPITPVSAPPLEKPLPGETDAKTQAEQEDAAETVALATADDELLDIFRDEALKHLGVLNSFLAGMGGEDASAVPDELIVRALHTLTGSARMTGVHSTARVTAPLERLFLAHQTQGIEPDPSLLQLLARAVDALEMRLEHLPDPGDEMAVLQEIAAELQARSAPVEAGEETPAEEPVATPEEGEEPSSPDDLVAAEIAEPESLEELAPAAELSDRKTRPVSAADKMPIPQDRELVNLFLEDAREIVDRLDQGLRDLQRSPDQSEPLEAMQRSLHTLKGSARLSGLTPIGDLSHAFESLLIAAAHGEARVPDDILTLAQRTLDTLSDQIDAVERRADLRRADDLIQALALALEEGLAGAPEEASQVDAIEPSPPTADRPRTAIAPAVPAPLQAEPAPFAAHAETTAPKPQIRVRSDLIDRLVNNAGEISIYRSRLAQQGGLMAFRLGELDRTVDRLRGQLRYLEIETEAQILNRFERNTEFIDATREGEFDPLELDRFSTLQQLSRSLVETVNDLVSLRTILRDLQSESDTLLLQQARISNDLQDGLLRSRMVPFAQAVPRLHRLVRQTAHQLGKEARLEVFGPEVEVDRSIQERILAPLEHLLRNAVAHGIEPPEQRRRTGKSSSGVISLALNREGNDVVITIADDGAGLDLEAIRARALERGLITKTSDVGEEELTGLILESGFSTAEKVSQIAGRGVGLDVVNTEVKQLSGSFGLESKSGQGTKFSIRLPLTLAIIDALLVQLDDQVFAIPHATIEAVSRISRAELEDCYQGRGSDFSYAGHDFRVTYLGSMLQVGGVPDLGERRWLPVLLARSGEQRIAFHVEQLLGSQRIVVKPLGPELSNIRWLSGGTILADGRVALIVDLLALIRSAAVQELRAPVQAPPQERARRPCVMVVDDSLTVRRVTNRMLQRQNMDVIMAQDGIDALTRLEERVPDVILLDIEMPRMDGYELTRHIRRSERLKDIPVIMITSRTGEKHRRHALDLGVNRYLGKPYQETDLLDEISSVLVEAAL